LGSSCPRKAGIRGAAVSFECAARSAGFFGPSDPPAASRQRQPGRRRKVSFRFQLHQTQFLPSPRNPRSARKSEKIAPNRASLPPFERRARGLNVVAARWLFRKQEELRSGSRNVWFGGCLLGSMRLKGRC